MNITYINELCILIILFFDDPKKNTKLRLLKLDMTNIKTIIISI